MISMVILVLNPLRTLKTTNKLNETTYMVLRPSVSEKDDLFAW